MPPREPERTSASSSVKPWAVNFSDKEKLFSGKIKDHEGPDPLTPHRDVMLVPITNNPEQALGSPEQRFKGGRPIVGQFIAGIALATENGAPAMHIHIGGVKSVEDGQGNPFSGWERIPRNKWHMSGGQGMDGRKSKRVPAFSESVLALMEASHERATVFDNRDGFGPFQEVWIIDPTVQEKPKPPKNTDPPMRNMPWLLEQRLLDVLYLEQAEGHVQIEEKHPGANPYHIHIALPLTEKRGEKVVPATDPEQMQATVLRILNKMHKEHLLSEAQVGRLAQASPEIRQAMSASSAKGPSR